MFAAAVSVGSLVAAFALRPGVALEMDRDLPRVLGSGLYPAERSRDQSFAWTAARATLKLPGLDRAAAWTCVVRFRGARQDASTLPEITVDVDGVTAARRHATNDFADLRIDIPRSERAGLVLTIVPSNTFRPGPADKRELGIQIDRLACVPSAFAWPPARTMWRGAAAAAVFGAAAALIGSPVVLIAVILLVIALGQAVLLSSGLAAYSQLPETAVPTAVIVALVAVALVGALRYLRADPLSWGALAAVLLSGVAFYLKVIGLLHPSKFLIDALFHAHRLEWVLSGRYLFTQPMPGGVSFPYAIGLYVFAWPWTSLTTDYVSLLRIVVTAAEVTAGGLLYVLVVKTSRDVLAGALAVVLYNCAPVTFEILGNANMTNVFGQAVALAAVVCWTLWPAGRRHLAYWPLAFAVCTLAFLSHISTFSQLTVTLLVLAALYWWIGGGHRRVARTIVLTAVAAAVVAVALYYGHFIDVYRTAWHARTRAPVAQQGPDAASPSPAVAEGSGAPLHVRAGNALRLTANSLGWPLLALAGVGAWRIRRDVADRRLACAVAALGLTWVIFLAASTASRVDAPFERYAAEFGGRVVLATFPAAVVLAAVGASWGWRAGAGPRIVSAIAVVSAVAVGVGQWMQWFR